MKTFEGLNDKNFIEINKNIQLNMSKKKAN